MNDAALVALANLLDTAQHGRSYETWEGDDTQLEVLHRIASELERIGASLVVIAVVLSGNYHPELLEAWEEDQR